MTIYLVLCITFFALENVIKTKFINFCLINVSTAHIVFAVSLFEKCILSIQRHISYMFFPN